MTATLTLLDFSDGNGNGNKNDFASCFNCRFSIPYTTGLFIRRTRLYCHRWPTPQPEVYPNNWCGEWEEN